MQALLARGRAKGELTLDAVLEVMKDVEVSTDVILGVRTLLHSQGIALDETLDSAALPSGGPKPRTTKAPDTGGSGGDSQGATADPVRMYLKEIGRVSLLNGEQEVELAKRIEVGTKASERLADAAAAAEVLDHRMRMNTFPPSVRPGRPPVMRSARRARWDGYSLLRTSRAIIPGKIRRCTAQGPT